MSACSPTCLSSLTNCIAHRHEVPLVQALMADVKTMASNATAWQDASLSRWSTWGQLDRLHAPMAKVHLSGATLDKVKPHGRKAHGAVNTNTEKLSICTEKP